MSVNLLSPSSATASSTDGMEVPIFTTVERIVEVPQVTERIRVEYVAREKLVEVPRIIMKEKRIEVPTVEYIEIEVPKIEYIDRIIEVPVHVAVYTMDQIERFDKLVQTDVYMVQMDLLDLYEVIPPVWECTTLSGASPDPQ